MHRRRILHDLLSIHLIHNLKCVVAIAGPGTDVAQPLEWPGRSFAVEVLAAEPGPDGSSLYVDLGGARRHAEAPLPVYYVADIAPWEDGGLDPIGFGSPPYLDQVIAVWPARSMASWLQDKPARGGARVDLDDLPVLGWRDFVRALMAQPASVAPWSRIGSVTPLSPALLDDPELARKIADEQTDPRVGESIVFGEEIVLPLAESLPRTPPAFLYEYVPSEDGYVERDAAALRDEVRHFVDASEAERIDESEGLMVVTLPWQSQIRDARPLGEKLGPLLRVSAVL